MFMRRSSAPHARLKIDVNRVIGDVHPLLFGNFAEHLGVMGAGSSARCQGDCAGGSEIGSYIALPPR